MNWHGRHYNEDLRPEHILYQNGVLGKSQQPFRHLLPGDKGTVQRTCLFRIHPYRWGFKGGAHQYAAGPKRISRLIWRIWRENSL